jgi:pyruvate dehydrogenase E2 component (dihydrolipoyllysine-residue acetyltransferase)
MATDVILPALGIAQDTGKIIEWLKAEGDEVIQGEPLVVIETDKAMVDLEAPASGMLTEVSAVAGDEVPVAQVIAVIVSPEEAMRSRSTPPPPEFRAVPAPLDSPTESSRSALYSAPATGAPSASALVRNGRRAASPKARRIATERGVNIAAIAGSGPGGVVLAADVLASSADVASMWTPTGATVVAPTPGSAHVALNGQPIAASSAAGDATISSVWRLMAERTTQSWTSIPHFFLLREVNAAALMSWRARAARQVSAEITYTDLLVKIVAEALRQHPRLNASWDQSAITAHDEINIGLAVATENGLVVPVIHRADDLSLKGIARQRADLVKRAQAQRLRLDDLQNATFTISNLGMYGIDAFTAIINAPQAAILAVGRIVDRVVPVSGLPSVQPMLTLSLSCDHRVVDGARGAQFLAHVAQLIEDPSMLTE